MSLRRGVTMKVDKDLAQIIEDLAKKNELSFREASREVAKNFKLKKSDIKF